MAEFFSVLLFIGLTYGAYKVWLLVKNRAYGKEYRDLSEGELWSEYNKLNEQLEEYFDPQSPKRECLPPKLLLVRRSCLLKEMERRDLIDMTAGKERKYRDRLVGLADVLVFNEFNQQLNTLTRDNPNPRSAAIRFALAREEYIKRKQQQYGSFSNDELQKAYEFLSQGCEGYFSRTTYEEYMVVCAEMQKRGILAE